MVFSTDLFLEYKKRPGRAALTRLLERHQDAVYTLCRRVLHHPQDAEDACQEILLEISRQVDAIDEPEKFAGWLYRTALHTALDFKRQRGRRRIREARAVPASEAEPAESAEALHQGLAGLDDTSRALVVEHYFGRRPLRELAAERGCSEVAVWKRIESARERLKRMLGSAALPAIEGIANVPAPAGLLPKALGFSGGLTMATKIGIKVAIVAPLVLLAGAGTVLMVRHPDPPPAPRPAVGKTVPFRVAPPTEPSSGTARAPLPASLPPPAARPRKPYPFKDPVAGYPAAAVRTWSVLTTKRVTLDLANEPLPKILETLALLTGLSLVPANGLDQEIISFKATDILAESVLKLMLKPRMKSYEILADGTIRVDTEDRIQGGYEGVGLQAAARLEDFRRVDEALKGGWDGVSRTDHGLHLEELVRKKHVVSTSRQTTLTEEIHRLRELGVHVRLDRRDEPGDPDLHVEMMSKRFFQVAAEGSLEDHLQDLARIFGMVAVPCDGTVVFTKAQNAAPYRAEAEKPRQEHQRHLEILQIPVELSGTVDVSEFLDSVGRSHGLLVLPTEAAWNSPVTLSLSAGTTLRQALDQLKARGFRWAVRAGNLYVLR